MVQPPCPTNGFNLLLLYFSSDTVPNTACVLQHKAVGKGSMTCMQDLVQCQNGFPSLIYTVDSRHSKPHFYESAKFSPQTLHHCRTHTSNFGKHKLPFWWFNDMDTEFTNSKNILYSCCSWACVVASGPYIVDFYSISNATLQKQPTLILVGS